MTVMIAFFMGLSMEGRPKVEWTSMVKTLYTPVALLLFGPFAVALLCYIWTFSSCKIPGPRSIRPSAFVLLLCDALTIIFGLFWGIMLLYGEKTYLVFLDIWVACRLFSQCQHLITAFVSLIVIHRPKWGTYLRTVSIGFNLVPIILIILIFRSRIGSGSRIGLDVCNLLLVLGIVATYFCPASSSSVSNQRTPIALLSVLFYILICLPNTVLLFLEIYTHDMFFIKLFPDVFFVTNLYIILNPLLIRLVQKVEEENQSDSQTECALALVQSTSLEP